MRKTYRQLLSALLFTAAAVAVVGCGDSGGVSPKSDTNANLKPLPTPGSPGEGTKPKANQPGAGANSQ